MNGLEAVLNMLVNVALQIIVAFARIIDSLSNSEAGKELGLNGNNYAGAPTAPTPPLTVEALQHAGVGTALKFLIPIILIHVFLPRVFSAPKKGR